MIFERRGSQLAPRVWATVGDDRWDVTSIVRDIDEAAWRAGALADARSAIDRGMVPRVSSNDRLPSLAPIARPGKIVCVGLNYRAHARETGTEEPSEPVLFLKDPRTVIGPFEDVRIPPGSRKTDWEVELGVVMAAEASYLETTAQAEEAIGGYLISHDVSEREYQLERGGQWDKGKSCPTFNPLGPLLVTADSISSADLELRLSVNGVLRQRGLTSDMIFTIPYLVHYISQFMTLYPGDLINTGTPAGVALGMSNPRYLAAGDLVELEITGLGRAAQRMVAT